LGFFKTWLFQAIRQTDDIWTHTHRQTEMVAISVALQKAVELQERSLVLKEAHIILYTDSRSTIQKLAKATGKEEIVHHVLSLVEQIAAGGNA